MFSSAMLIYLSFVNLLACSELENLEPSNNSEDKNSVVHKNEDVVQSIGFSNEQVLALYNQYEPTFLQDLKEIQFLEKLLLSNCSRNVGEWMHPRMRWDVDEGSKAATIIQAWKEKQHVEPIANIDFMFQSKARKRQWLNALEEYPREIDWQWYDEVANQYDCWDVDEFRPRMELDWEEPTVVAIPNWIGLQNWTKYRLIVALQTGDKEELLRALTSTRKWAKIMFTSEQLVGEMIGIVLLKLEREAFEEGSKRGLKLNWTPISHEQVKQLRRTIFASVNYFAFWTPETKFSVADKIQFGRCSAINDGMTLSWIAKGALSTVKGPQIQHIDKWKEQCRLTWMKRAWQKPPSFSRSQLRQILCEEQSELSICRDTRTVTETDINTSFNATVNIPAQTFWSFYEGATKSESPNP